MLRTLIALLVLATWCPAATLQGLILDHETGRPLARSLVLLEAVSGTGNGGRLVVRSDVHGLFSFPSIPNGAYLLTASRSGFAAMHYGEKSFGKPGKAILLDADLLGVELRLHRLGSVSGILWDENQIGLPEIPVLIYSASRPITLVAHGVTDDRGMYRIAGLPPGSYLVRNASHPLEDGSAVTPSFFQETVSAVQARPVEVRIDQTTSGINFQPGFGKTFRISGRLNIPVRPFSGTVDLISDTGRQSTGTDENGNFSFDGIAAGQYELFSEARLQYRQHYGAHQALLVEHDLQGLALPMYPVYPVKVTTPDNSGKDAAAPGMAIFARRKDLDTEGSAIKIVPDKTELAPGNWEFFVQPPATSYTASVTLANQTAPPAARGDSWVPVYLEPGAKPSLRVALSSHPAQLSGRVTAAVNEPAVGVPVYLETMDGDPNAKLEIRTVYTDQTGRYSFTGLPPGRYLLASSADIDLSDRSSLESVNGKVLSLKEADQVIQDLP